MLGRQSSGLLSAVVLLAALLVNFYSELFSGGCGHDGLFCPGACDRLESSLDANVVGQELALTQVSSAVCDHVSKRAVRPHASLDTVQKKKICLMYINIICTIFA